MIVEVNSELVVSELKNVGAERFFWIGPKFFYRPYLDSDVKGVIRESQSVSSDKDIMCLAVRDGTMVFLNGDEEVNVHQSPLKLVDAKEEN